MRLLNARFPRKPATPPAERFCIEKCIQNQIENTQFVFGLKINLAKTKKWEISFIKKHTFFVYQMNTQKLREFFANNREHKTKHWDKIILE